PPEEEGRSPREGPREADRGAREADRGQSPAVIEIDGGHGEGGGQVLRTALSVASALGRAFVLDRVRHNRKPPGLKAQHLECVLACARLSGARVEGAKVGSNTVAFEPTKRPEAGSYRFEIKTAGATGLLLHAAAFPLSAKGR